MASMRSTVLAVTTVFSENATLRRRQATMFATIASKDLICRTSSFDLAIVRERIAILGRWYHGELIVRCIDIRSKDYWVIENDGTLWIERWREDLDLRVCGLDDLLALAAIRL